MSTFEGVMSSGIGMLSISITASLPSSGLFVMTSGAEVSLISGTFSGASLDPLPSTVKSDNAAEVLEIDGAEETSAGSLLGTIIGTSTSAGSLSVTLTGASTASTFKVPVSVATSTEVEVTFSTTGVASKDASALTEVDGSSLGNVKLIVGAESSALLGFGVSGMLSLATESFIVASCFFESLASESVFDNGTDATKGWAVDVGFLSLSSVNFLTGLKATGAFGGASLAGTTFFEVDSLAVETELARELEVELPFSIEVFELDVEETEAFDGDSRAAKTFANLSNCERVLSLDCLDEETCLEDDGRGSSSSSLDVPHLTRGRRGAHPPPLPNLVDLGRFPLTRASQNFFKISGQS